LSNSKVSQLIVCNGLNRHSSHPQLCSCEILADIVTQEGSLVQRLAIDRRTGALRQVD